MNDSAYSLSAKSAELSSRIAASQHIGKHSRHKIDGETECLTTLFKIQIFTATSGVRHEFPELSVRFHNSIPHHHSPLHTTTRTGI